MSIAERGIMAIDSIDHEVDPHILSSTGRLGVSRRPDERLYVNGPRFSSNPDEVDINLRRLMSIGERHERIGRTVFRGLVSEAVMQHISTSDLRGYLEVALPVREFTSDSSWLISMARNRAGRELITPHESMIRETSLEGKEVTPPTAKIKSVIEQGYTFTDEIKEDEVDQVYALWGETFGWKKENEEIENLARRLREGRLKHPSKRDVWFSAIKKGGKIISVAMAERLAIPGENGMLDLVESTEWSIDNDHARNGIMTANLDMLQALILSDLGTDPSRFPPLIFAECNFQSHAERVGRGAGLRIPDRSRAPQILAQNVLIRDGQKIEEGKKRDFTFMYLPVDVMQSLYSPAQVAEMTQAVKSNSVI